MSLNERGFAAMCFILEKQEGWSMPDDVLEVGDYLVARAKAFCDRYKECWGKETRISGTKASVEMLLLMMAVFAVTASQFNAQIRAEMAADPGKVEAMLAQAKGMAAAD